MKDYKLLFIPALVAASLSMTLLIGVFLGKVDITVALAFIGGSLMPIWAKLVPAEPKPDLKVVDGDK